MRFSDQVVVVTGGSRGIGRAICIEAAKQGASVIINYARSRELAYETRDFIRSSGGRAEVYQADVSQYEEARRMIDEVLASHGRIDVLINNAGISRDRLIYQMEPEDWKAVMQVNFGSVFNCTKAVLEPMMLQREGVIVNVSSAMSEGGWVGQANYASSKAAINAFTRTAAVELARFNIRVCAVLPGFSETDMVKALLKDSQRYLPQIPQRRFASPEEVARAVLFMASSDASHITGAALVVDGGVSSALGIGKPL